MASKWLKYILKLVVLAGCLYVSAILGLFLIIVLSSTKVSLILVYLGALFFPTLCIPLIFSKKRKRIIKIWSTCLGIYLIVFAIHFGYVKYNESITIDTSPNIELHEYLPFDEHSKIATLENSASLSLQDDLPVVDGAAALFPVYSAFVNATYPDDIELYDGVFEYNNTVGGYKLLAEQQTDIFFGVYPSQEQIQYAKECGTELICTPIGYDAFIFFVHKDNPITNLTTKQIQAIYSGEITNWKDVGGIDKKIAAFQRNEGSGSQSMLERFMDGQSIMEAPSEMVNDFMFGIIEQVADYKNKDNSIGFSFRYYVEKIIQNPDIKIISVDGVYPSVKHIKNGSYSITTPFYAVTYKENENPHVDELIQWVLSKEGQELIEKTGYVGINE